jgi:peptidoglycan biosynthesis protein MviN/MurJ (putative lipid II flippase)
MRSRRPLLLTMLVVLALGLAAVSVIVLNAPEIYVGLGVATVFVVVGIVGLVRIWVAELHETDP